MTYVSGDNVAREKRSLIGSEEAIESIYVEKYRLEVASRLLQRSVRESLKIIKQAEKLGHSEYLIQYMEEIERHISIALQSVNDSANASRLAFNQFIDIQKKEKQ